MLGGDGVSVSQDEQSYGDARWCLRNDVGPPLNRTLKNKMINFVMCIPLCVCVCVDFFLFCVFLTQKRKKSFSTMKS